MGRGKPYLIEMYEPDRINFLIRCGHYHQQRGLLHFKFVRRYGVTYEEWIALAGFYGGARGEKREDFIKKYLTNYGKA